MGLHQVSVERAHSWEEAKQEALQAKLDALLSERAFRLLVALSQIIRWMPLLAPCHSSDLPENASCECCSQA